MPYCQKKYDDLLSSAVSKADKARLRAIASPHSSDWLNAVPVASLGLKLSDSNIRIACGLRLGSPLCHTHLCHCGKRVDESVTHGLSCQKGIGRLARHDHINKLVKEEDLQKSLQDWNPKVLQSKIGKGLMASHTFLSKMASVWHGIIHVQTPWLKVTSKSSHQHKLVKQRPGWKMEN